MSNPIVVESIAENLIVRFNRPEIRNPLSVAVLEKLHAVIDQASGDRKIKKIIFTGKDDVFASGADLREIAHVKGETAAREFALRGQLLMRKIESAPQATIAAINGFCFGGALDLSLSCSRRIASPNAQFAHPGADLGIITGWGGTQRLPHLVGEAAALEMFLTAKRVDAREAFRIGLIDAVDENPLERAV